MAINFFLIFSGFAASILFYLFAIIVINSNPKSWKNRSFFLYLTTKGVAVVTTVLIPLAFSLQQVELYFRIFSISVIFFSSYLLLFALSFYLDDKKTLKAFLVLTLLSVILSIIWYLIEFYIIYPTDYGWFYNYNLFGYLYIVGYYAVLEGIAIILIWKFMRKIISSTIRYYMKMVSLSFSIHYILAAGINIGGRFLFNTSEYDLLWTVSDIILFGIAIFYFLKLKMRE